MRPEGFQTPALGPRPCLRKPRKSILLDMSREGRLHRRLACVREDVAQTLGVGWFLGPLGKEWFQHMPIGSPNMRGPSKISALDPSLPLPSPDLRVVLEIL